MEKNYRRVECMIMEQGCIWQILGDGVRNELPKDISQAEIAASYIENLLRSEQGLPIRTSYSPDAENASTLVDVKKY